MDYIIKKKNDELIHYGVKGMKWGVRRSNKPIEYKSTSLSAVFAKRSNDKVDSGFKKWKENTNKKQDAIDLGKKANVAKIAYEKDRSNKSLKSEYKKTSKEYKKALRNNTTYRKGIVRQEVGRDMSRKYLSEAKKVKKELTADPTNKQLKKTYNDLMSKHDIERAKARKAPEVSAKRMRKKAALKRTMTMTVKSAAVSAAIGAGGIRG